MHCFKAIIDSTVMVLQHENNTVLSSRHVYAYIFCMYWKAVNRECCVLVGLFLMTLIMLKRIYWSVMYRFVAVSVVDMEFLAIDFNPCPRSDGNDPPNYFYNVSRCKPSTTVSSLHDHLNIICCIVARIGCSSCF